MRNVGEIIFEPRPKESQEEYDKRVGLIAQKLKTVFNNPAGLEVLNILVDASNPFAPRFGDSRTAEEAAFLDGERHIIGWLILNGTTKTPTSL